MKMREQTPQAPTPAEAQNLFVQVNPGVPTTAADVSALRAQRTELSNQLVSVQGRRDDIVEQLRTASVAERPGLEARLKVIDERIVQIEQEIARTGELMAQTPGHLLAGNATQIPNIGGLQFRSVDVTGISIVFTLFVLAPIALTVARLLWKRANVPPRPRIDAETQERLRRLESAVDAVAIEVERVSEGQRFVTRLLSEREKARVPMQEG